MAKWPDTIGWPGELKENCVKKFTRTEGKLCENCAKSRGDVSKSVWSPIDEKLCQKVDEISASLFGPQLKKNSLKSR
jgi:hypothetical protein